MMPFERIGSRIAVQRSSDIAKEASLVRPDAVLPDSKKSKPDDSVMLDEIKDVYQPSEVLLKKEKKKKDNEQKGKQQKQSRKKIDIRI